MVSAEGPYRDASSYHAGELCPLALGELPELTTGGWAAILSHGGEPSKDQHTGGGGLRGTLGGGGGEGEGGGGEGRGGVS